MKKIIFPLILTTFLLSACVGKNFKKPETDLPAEQTEQSAENKDEQINKDISAFETEQWWHIFQDVVLDKFEEEALKYNYDLKAAMARVQKAKANLAVARSNYYPTINLYGQVADSKSNRRMHYDLGIDSGRFAVGVSASYEIDLWGKYWRSGESSKATFLATKADEDAVRLTLTASVAQAYFQYMALDSQLEIAQSTLKSREDSFDIYTKRFNKGVINELDLRRVEAEMESVRAKVYSTEQALKQAETALSILIGRSPKSMINETLDKGNKIRDVLIIPQIPTAVPSDLISRRPDIKASEYTLKSYNAEIGTAKAELFPSISLTGKAGFASYELEDLFKEDSDTWSYSGDILWPIFSGGKNMKTYQAKKAEYEEALSSYQKTIQTAFKEVLDAINNYSLSEKVVQATQQQSLALQKSYELVLKREKAGLTDLLDVLDVERSLLDAEMSLVSAKQDQLNAVIDICKALGGGWTEQDGFKK
jgi:multidrug efflux system outer membrane protein